MRQYFGDDLPPLQDIIKNTSFVLVNHHHSLGFPRPYVPNMIEIAGMHIDPPQSLANASFEVKKKNQLMSTF